MCDYCSQDNQERAIAREYDLKLAADLMDFATILRNIANGRIALHDSDSEHYIIKARRIIRALVNDWM